MTWRPRRVDAPKHPKIRMAPVGWLYHRYAGQTSPQPCYVELDPRTGELSADWNREIGNGVPEDVWNGHRQRWSIPALRKEAATALLSELVPLAERMCAGYSGEWHGEHFEGHFTADAVAAAEGIEALCGSVSDDDRLAVWQASEWFDSVGSAKAQAAALGVTAESTDAELSAIAEREEKEAEGSDGCDGVEGVEEHLEWLRRKCQRVDAETVWDVQRAAMNPEGDREPRE